MNILSYLIAIVVIAAGAWFSYDTKTKFTDLHAKVKDVYSTNETREKTIAKTKKSAVAAESERDTAQVDLSEVKSDFETKEGNLNLKQREKATWTDKIAGQEDKLEEIDTLITSIKQTFSDLNVDLEDVPALVKGLEEDVKEGNVKLEELNELASSAESSVEKNEGELTGLRERIAKRAERIKSNSLEGFVTSINHEWGVAIVSVPTKMPIDSSSKLMVRRGNTYIGKLKISSIEGNRVITDIDYKSLKQGMILQTGDTVFLAKPVSN